MFSSVAKREVNSTRFGRLCKKTMSTRKRSARDSYFTILEYTLIISVRRKDSKNEIDIIREKEPEKSYEKFYRVQDDGYRDTSFTWRATFDDICHVGLPVQRQSWAYPMWKIYLVMRRTGEPISSSGNKGLSQWKKPRQLPYPDWI